jgi:multidrug efflux pump subunit AcrA (membrane-fusion protein)
MRKELILDLADCTEFRQTLLARPPRIVHGTAVLLALLLAAALAWAALTRADLVVRAPGRVRPVTAPVKVFNGGRGEVLSASTGGRVVEVNCREGDEVRRGDVLVRLDTGRLDNDIARRKQTIQAGEEELARTGRLLELQTQQYAATRAKAEAELAQAEEEVRQAKRRQAADVGQAEAEAATARDEVDRLRRLASNRSAAAADLVKAEGKFREAKEKLEKARVPVDVGRVAVYRQALALAEKDHAVKQEELAVKRVAKQGEVAAARVELAGLELERQQAVLRAPVDGVVVRGDIKVGDLLEPGKAVVEIAQQRGFRFEVLVPSEEMAHLRVGMSARIKLDAYDYQKYGALSGTVCFVAPDSEVPEAQARSAGEGTQGFSLHRSASEGTVSQRAAHYLVRIEVDGDQVGRGELRGQVKLGMAGQTEIVTDQESILLLLVRKIRQTISLG